MKKISKLINCIVLLAMPSVAFSMITRDKLNNMILEADRPEWDSRVSYVDIVSILIREGVDPKDDTLLRMREVFFSMLKDDNFANRHLRVDSFDNLIAALGDYREIGLFVRRIEFFYNCRDLFSETLGRLIYNKINGESNVSCFLEGYEYFLKYLNPDSLEHIKALLGCFLSIKFDPEIWRKQEDLSPEILFFGSICEGSYRMLWLNQEYFKQELKELPMEACMWCCDCAFEGNCCSSLAVLRLFVLDRELAGHFLTFLKEHDIKQLRELIKEAKVQAEVANVRAEEMEEKIEKLERQIEPLKQKIEPLLRKIKFLNQQIKFLKRRQREITEEDALKKEPEVKKEPEEEDTSEEESEEPDLKKLRQG